MAYSYDPIFAVDPNSPSNVARNASILIFELDDATKTPVTLTDITGSPIANPITVNQHGFGPAIKHATLDRLAWEGAGMSGVFTSYEGMKEEAVAARVAAQTAATEAGAAAQADLEGRIAAGQFKGEKGNDGSNVLPTDTAIKNAITTPGTQTEAALSAAVAKAQPSNAFPTRKLSTKLNARLMDGTVQQGRVVAFGDSIALFKWHALYPALSRAFGGTTTPAGIGPGSGVSGTGWSLPGVSNSGTTGTVTLQTNAFNIWPSGYADSYATGATKNYGSFGGNATWDKAKIYYAKESGSGTFKVQVDGVDEPGYENVSAAGTGLGVITITRGTVASRQVKVVNLTGTHRVIGAAFESSTTPGVVFANVSQGGIALDQQTTQGYANFQTFLADFNPDLITFEMKENSSYFAASLETLLDVVDAAAPTATFVGIGSTPTAANDADQVVQNAQLRAACEAHGKIYWDGYQPFGDYATMDALGWAGDGIHVDEKASSFLAGLMARDLGLFDHAGSDRPFNVNAKKVTALEKIILGLLGNVDLTGSADIVLSGSTAGAGHFIFKDAAGGIKARFPIGGASSQAVLPNTAQLGEGNARWTADTNGIAAYNPAGNVRSNITAKQVVAIGEGIRPLPVTTANRPIGANVGDGTIIVDSTLGKAIMWMGGAWKNLDGTALA